MFQVIAAIFSFQLYLNACEFLSKIDISMERRTHREKVLY